MASTCKSVVGCIEAHEPVRATYVNLYKWPESDAEFVRSLTVRKARAKDDYQYQCDTDNSRNEKRKHVSSPIAVDSYSCRQIYLRSYTFSKKETTPEKTVKYLRRVRDKVALFSFLHQSDENFDCNSNRTVNSEKKKKKKKKKKRKKKECVTPKKLRDASCNVVWLIFHRLLACTASVDVVDR